MTTRRLAAEASDTLLPGKATKLQLWTTVPQTDTGARDEYSKALERTLEKELGKLTPSSEVTVSICRVPSPEFSQAP